MKIDDIPQEKRNSWADQDITRSVVTYIREHRDATAKAFMAAGGNADEVRGYYRGLSDAIKTLGGEP